MNALTLGLIFLAAIVVSGCVVVAFSRPMDAVLQRVLSGEMAMAWSKYVKFAVLVASFSGGLRLNQIAALANPPPPLTINQGLLEIFRTMVGSLEAASWTLLAFFGATLAAYAVMNVYATLKETRYSRTPGDYSRH